MPVAPSEHFSGSASPGSNAFQSRVPSEFEKEWKLSVQGGPTELDSRS